MINKAPIMLITDAQQGLGDGSAVMKLVNALLANNPERPIVWLVIGNENALNHAMPEAVTLIQMKDWIECFQNRTITDYFKTAAMVAVYPAFLRGIINPNEILSFDFLPGEIRILLEHCRKDQLPLTFILEYGYLNPDLFERAKRDFPKCYFIKTGIMDDAFGIFLEDNRNIYPSRCLERLPAELQKRLGFTTTTLKSYHDTHALFVGYYSREFDKVLNPHISPITFIHVIAELAEKDWSVQRAHVFDVMLPFEFEQMEQLNYARIFKLGFCEVIFQDYEGVETITASGSNTGRVLRILQMPYLPPQVFRDLLNAAHPFSMCTGDQSLAEVLSKNNLHPYSLGIPFYQTMSWKLVMMIEMLLQSVTLFGIKDKLTLYLSCLTPQAGEIKPADIAYYVSHGVLRFNLLKFNAWLKKYKNLAEHLPKYLEACIAEGRMLDPEGVLPTTSTDERDYWQRNNVNPNTLIPLNGNDSIYNSDNTKIRIHTFLSNQNHQITEHRGSNSPSKLRP